MPTRRRHLETMCLITDGSCWIAKGDVITSIRKGRLAVARDKPFRKFKHVPIDLLGFTG